MCTKAAPRVVLLIQEVDLILYVRLNNYSSAQSVLAAHHLARFAVASVSGHYVFQAARAIGEALVAVHELATQLLGQGMSRIVAETRRIVGAAARQMFYPHVAHQRCRGASAAARRCVLSPPRTTASLRWRGGQSGGCF